MENTYKTEDSVFAVLSGSGAPYYEFSRDFILPDSYPDLRTLLVKSADFELQEAYPENGKLPVEGTAFVQVLFSDDENLLHRVVFDLPFAFDCTLPECRGTLRKIVRPSLKNLSVKVLNPRKLAVKLSVDPGLALWDELPLSLADPYVLSHAQIRKETVRTMEICAFGENALSFSEDVSVENDLPPVDEIAYAALTPVITECRYEGGKLNVRANAEAQILYEADGKHVLLNKKIPFTASVDAEGLDPDAELFADVRIGRCTFTPSEDETGDCRVIEADFSCGITVVCRINAENTGISDLYVPGMPSETESETVRCHYMERPAAFTQNRRVPFSADGEPIAFFPEPSAAQDGKSVECGIAVLCKKDDGTFAVEHVKDVFCPESGELGAAQFLRLDVSDRSMRRENDGYALIYTVGGQAAHFSEKEITFVRNVRCGAPEKLAQPEAILCYCRKNETDFDVAKKYLVSLQDYHRDNPENEKRDCVLIMKKT